ncbi:MAG: Hpt domain-containing protein [Treponema sp.]|nr:Hpt domain-containing protein [Treponema sp.]
MADDTIYVNVEEGSKRVMNNIKLYVKLLAKFKLDSTCKEVEDALAEGNMEKAQNAAHTLKGLTANLSLSELYKQCLELETQIKNGSVQEEQLEIVKNVYEMTLTEVDRILTLYA